MANTIWFQLAQRFPDSLRSDGFAGMHGKAESVAGSVFINFAKLLWPSLSFIATNPDAGDIHTLTSNRLIHDAPGFIDSEMTHGIEDPIQRDAKVAFAALAPAFRTFKKGRNLLPAPVPRARRYVHLRVHHALRMQLLHHA